MPKPTMAAEVVGVVAMIVKDHEALATCVQPRKKLRPDEQALPSTGNPGQKQMTAGQKAFRIRLTEIPEIKHLSKLIHGSA